MLLKVLGSAGAEFPGHSLPSFMIDGDILLDAGTIGSELTETEQWNIKNILITHSHLDHIRGIPFLADNIVIKKKRHSFTVLGIRESLRSLSKNLLNDEIWPDFTKISSSDVPVIKLKNISASRPFRVGRYTIRACRVNHTVPAVGYVITGAGGEVLLYTGDTGPTEAIWRVSERVDAVIAEVSFPNRMEELAKTTGHLTAKLLAREVEKMRTLPARILVTHPKPQYIGRIREEIGKIGHRTEMLENGAVYRI